MENYHCDIHNLDIVIYEKEEEKLFIDDNKEEIAIFYHENGTKYLKRFVINKCNENCKITQILLSDNNSKEFLLLKKQNILNNIKILENNLAIIEYKINELETVKI